MLKILHKNGLARTVASTITPSRASSPAKFPITSRCLSTDHSTPALKKDSEKEHTQEHESEVIFSGIQPTGVPHLGNYLGALRQWVKLQNTAAPTTQLFYSIVDLHSLTARQDPSFRRQSKRDMLAALLAVGIDPQRSTLFHQSAVPAHSELHWILSCDASVGWLSRMTQWKSKMLEGGNVSSSSIDETDDPLATTSNPASTARLKLGLFSYPVLQAADILLYRATHVPVGEDQAQHIEFARDCANVFNHVYAASKSPILIPPTTVLSPAKRVMSLADPTKKMSKSAPLPRSRILLTDSEEDIARKVRVALTDSVPGDISYDPVTRPGVSNLLEILAHMADDPDVTPEDIGERCRTLGLRALKEMVGAEVNKCLAPIRGEYERLLGERGGRGLDDVAEEGARKARETAGRTMGRVKRAIGIE